MAEILFFSHGQPPGIFIPLFDTPRCPLPLDGVKVSAGFPSPAADYEDQRLDINEYLVRNPVSTFFFAVEGDSHGRCGNLRLATSWWSIRVSAPRHGQIVIAFVDGERLVKRLYNRAGRVALMAENPALSAARHP